MRLLRRQSARSTRRPNIAAVGDSPLGTAASLESQPQQHDGLAEEPLVSTRPTADQSHAAQQLPPPTPTSSSEAADSADANIAESVQLRRQSIEARRRDLLEKQAALAAAKAAAAARPRSLVTSSDDLAKSFRAAATGKGPTYDSSQSVLTIAGTGSSTGTSNTAHSKLRPQKKANGEEGGFEVGLGEPSSPRVLHRLGSFQSFKQRTEAELSSKSPEGDEHHTGDEDGSEDGTEERHTLPVGARAVMFKESDGATRDRSSAGAPGSFVKRAAQAWHSRAAANARNGAFAATSLGSVHASVFSAIAPALRSLDLSNSGWRWKEAAAFVSLLPSLVSCTTLRLGSNAIGSRGAQAFASILKGNGAIRLASLHLDNCGLEDDGVACIAAALAMNDTLCELNLDSNRCGVTACRAISDALKVNVAIETIGLFCCGIDAEGARLIAEGLEENVSLLNLLMSENCVGDGGGNALAQALVLNMTLRRLWLASNGLSPDVRLRLAEACATHDPTAKYGKQGTAYTQASRQLYQSRFGERQRPVELLCD